MAKGLAVIQGANKVVFKALENGTIHLGSTDVAASVELIGSLKLDITGKDTGHFLKSVDADGNAQWAQVTAADVDVAASGLDLESHLSGMVVDRAALSAEISADIAEEAAARASVDTALDGRLTTAESNIGALQTELSTLIGGSTDEFGQTLSTIREIQEYLDGDGVNVQELISVAGTAIGDLTSFTADLSVNLSAEISSLGSGSDAGLSAEIVARTAGDAEISSNLSAELVDRAAADAEISSNLSAELVDRAAADAEISSNLSAELVNRAAADAEISSNLSAELVDRAAADAEISAGLSAELVDRAAADAEISAGLSAELVDRAAGDAEISANLSAELVDRAAGDSALQSEISANLSTSVVDVDGTANEVEVSIIESASGKTIVVGLPDDVSVASSLTVGGTANLNGDVNLGNDVTTDSVVVSGTFQAPKLTRAQATARYGLTTTQTGYDAYNGHMFYLNDDDDTSANAVLPEGQKWYFCEGGVWHASFFYFA